jgi:hypothetical protein
MVKFLTCWLRDPGDLPSDGGPPGGGGTGGPPGGDDGDPPCTETVDFYGCDPTTLTDPDGDGTFEGQCIAKITKDLSDWNCDISLVPECITLGTGVDGKVCEWCQTPNHPNCLDCCTDDFWDPPGGGDPNPCPAYVCEDPLECEKKDCTQTSLTEEQWTNCGWDGPDDEGNCTQSPGAGQCIIDSTEYFADSAYCRDFGGPDGSGCKIYCPGCPDGFLCQSNTGEFEYGNCNQSDQCEGTYNPDTEKCEYPSSPGLTCFPDKTECLEKGCECKNFIGCSLAISDNVDQCQQCNVTSAETDGEGNVTKCLFEDQVMFEGTEAETTCQSFYDNYKDSIYYFEPVDKADEGNTMLACRTTCKLGKDKCYKCDETPCYECIDPPTNMDLAGGGVPACVPAEKTGGSCVDSGNAPFLNADGEWACLTDEHLGDPTCGKDPDTGEGGCESCDDQNLYSTDNCDNECDGLSPGGGNFSLGGNKGYKRIYGGVNNPVYQKDINNTLSQNNRSFLPVRRGDLRTDLFKERVHIGIRACIDISNKVIPFSDKPFSDLSDRNLEKSIHDNIILKLNLAIGADGKSIKRKVLSSIRDLIILNRLNEFSLAELNSLADRVYEIGKDPKYAETRSSFNIRALNSIANESKAIELVTKTIWPLTSDSYDTTVGERMKYWKTLAPDLEKYFPVKTAEGVTTPFYYDINDQVPLGGSGTLTLSPGDFQRYTKSDGSIGEISVQSLKDTAGVLSIEVLQRVMAILGTEYDFKMTVTTDPTLRIDERYGVSNARKEFYMLTLQTSAIEDLPRENSFVARTNSQYKYEDNGPTRNQHVADKPFPFLELYVDAQDPIFNYITNDGVIEVESKDFVFDIFNDAGLPVIPRRGPVPTIVLYPTDRTEKVLTHQVSKHSSYGVREIIFKINPNPDFSDNWYATFLKEQRAFPDKGINVTKKDDIQALKYSVNTDNINNQYLYTSGGPALPRLKFGTRYAYSIAKELKDDYQVPSNNIVEWYEIYERMPIPMMKFMHKECTRFTRFKSLLAMGKVSSDNSVNALYPKLREVRSQDWLGDQDGDPTRPLSYLQVREGHTPVEPTPLD